MMLRWRTKAALKHFIYFLLLWSYVDALRPLGKKLLIENSNSHRTTRQLSKVPGLDAQSFPSLLLTLRGGASDLEESQSTGNGIISTVRGFLDSCLNSLDKQYPSIASGLRKFFSSLESVTGIQFVSKPAEKSKKRRKKSKKKSLNVEDEEEEKKSKSKASSKSKAGSSSKTTKKASSSKTEQKRSTSLASRTKKGKSAVADAHLKNEIKSSSPNYRIQQELKVFLKDPPPNLKVKVGKNLRVWIVTMKGAKDTIYEGETFKLRISFPTQYPTVPPSVYFLPPNIPVHEHVYTNGDICLSLLGKDWRPTMTAQSIAVSILSILSSAQSKSLPMDNARHALNKPGEYQKDWVYHDDNC